MSITPSAKGFEKALLDETEGASSSAGEQAGTSFGASFLAGLGGLAKVGVAIGATVGAAVVGAGVGLFKLGATFDDAFDKIRVTTGATGTELAGLQDSFKTVFADVPTDADSASSAIATLSQKLGLTGKPLESLSKQLLNLSRITGTDLNANMSAAVDVFNSFGITAADQPAKLDELFRASQKTGVSVDSLASTMAQAGPNLKQLGLNFEQSAGLVAIFGKAGVDVGAVLPALSKTIVQASKDGKNAGDVFRETFDRIKNAPSDTEAAGAAIDVFGARAGPKLAGLIREGKLGYEELATAIAQGGDTINSAAADTADFAEQWGTFKNQVLVGLEPLATKVFGAVGDAMEAIGPKVGPAIAAVTEGLTGLFDGGKQAIDAFVAAFKAGGNDITSSGFNGVAEGIGLALRDVYDWLKVKIPEAVAALKTAFDTAQTAISTTVGYVEDHKDAFATITAGVVAFAAALETVKTAQAGISAASGISSLAASLAPVLLAGGALGLVVAAIAAVGAAAFVAYQQFEPFRNVVDEVGRVIRDVAVAAFNALVGAAGAVAGAIGTVSGAFATAFGVVQTIVTTVVPIIVAAVQPIVDWIVAYLFPALASMVVFFATTWQAAYQVVAQAVGLIIQVVEPFVSHLIDVIQVGFELMRGAVEQAMNQIQTAIQVVLDILKPIWETGFNAMLTIVQTVFSLIQNAIETTLGVIQGIFSAATAFIRGDWDGFFNSLKEIATTVLDGAKSAIDTALNGIKDLFSTILGGIPAIIDGIADGVGTAAGGIADALRGAIDTIEGLVGRIKDAISSIPGAGVVGNILGAIPGLAAGGLVTRPTLAVVGEAGPEAVIPLDMFNQGVKFGQYPTFPAMAAAPTQTASSANITQYFYNSNVDAVAAARELSWTMLTAGR